MVEIHTHDYDFLQDPTAFSNKGYIYVRQSYCLSLTLYRALKTGTIIKYKYYNHNPSYYSIC